jgi:hypothetical protein
MTIDEAIKELEIARDVAEHEGLWGRMSACQLGIEALKRIKNERDIQGGLFNYELPGETKE